MSRDAKAMDAKVPDGGTLHEVPNIPMGPCSSLPAKKGGSSLSLSPRGVKRSFSMTPPAMGMGHVSSLASKASNALMASSSKDSLDVGQTADAHMQELLLRVGSDVMDPNVTNNSDLVALDKRRCVFVPIQSGLPKRGKAREACRHVNEAFERSLRDGFGFSVILFSFVYALFYAVRLAADPLFQNLYHEDFMEGLQYAVYCVRSVIIVCCLLLGVAPFLGAWHRNSQALWYSFQAVCLVKALLMVALQLAHSTSSYGYMVFDEAFVYTFLPLHPRFTTAMHALTIVVYAVVGEFVFSNDVRNTLILAGLCFLQGLAHMRRYNFLLAGYLDMCHIQQQKRFLADEEKSCDGLLRSMLPPSILTKLENGMAVSPEYYESVTVIFAEICHFNSISQRASASDAVVILNEVFRALDGITDKWGVYKVETVCEVYMAVAGCPLTSADHAQVAANTSLDMLACIRQVSDPGGAAPGEGGDACRIQRRQKVLDILDGAELQIHIGLHSGPIRAGVVGIRNTRFKLFGDTVNTASRMESTCEPQHVQVSPSTHALLTSEGGAAAGAEWAFTFEERGEIPIKGKGVMRPFYLVGSQPLAGKAKSSPAPSLAGDAGTSAADLPGTLANPPPVKDDDDGDASQEGSTADTADGNPKSRKTGANFRPEDIMGALVTLHNTMSIDNVSHTFTSSKAWITRPISGVHVSEDLTNSVDIMEGTRKLLNRPWFALRRLALKVTTDNCVKPHTLLMLDLDMPEYHRIQFPKQLRTLRFKGVLVILMVSSLAWMDFWTYANASEWSHSLHVSVALRNGLIIPVTLGLVMLTSYTDFFRRYGECTTIVLCLIIAMLVVHSAFTVYVGDPGYFVAFLLMYLDIGMIRFTWRVGSSLLMVIFYYILAGVLDSGDQLSSLVFVTMLFFCFSLAVHGQEHFSHLSDFKLRWLKRQTTYLKQVQDVKWQLLTDLLPPPIATRLLEARSPNEIIADVYQDVTILFADMKGFTAFSARLDPAELAAFLNSLFSAFDEILERFGLHKVEVIGDCYFVVSGAPKTDVNCERTPLEHAAFAAEAALAMVNVLPNVCEDESVCIRVGLHSGTVVGGVVGRKDPRFHLFGHTVKLANVMEEHSAPNRVQISPATHGLLKRLADNWRYDAKNIFTFEDRGLQRLPSEPEPLHTYFLVRSTWGRHYRMQKRRQSHRELGKTFRDAVSGVGTPNHAVSGASRMDSQISGGTAGGCDSTKVDFFPAACGRYPSKCKRSNSVDSEEDNLFPMD